MPPTEDDLPSRWQWLDWWFAPRWRALLSWVALAALMGWLMAHGLGRLSMFTSMKVFDQLWVHQPVYWHMIVEFITGRCQLYFLLFWFEPIILRLNFSRGLAWLAVRVIPASAAGLCNPLSLMGPVFFVSSALTIPVLLGWRTRPWLTLIAGVLTGAGEMMAFANIIHFGVGGYPPEWLLLSVPYGVVLLYGTRLLTPEERALRAVSAAKTQAARKHAA